MYPIQTVVYYDKFRTIYYNPYINQAFVQSKRNGTGTSYDVKGTIDSFLEEFLKGHVKKSRRKRLVKYIKTTRLSERRDQIAAIKAERMAVKAEIKAIKRTIKAQKVLERKAEALYKRMAKKGIVL